MAERNPDTDDRVLRRGNGDMIDATPWGEADDSVYVGAGHALVFFPDEVLFSHICDRGDRGILRCAPALQIANGGHQIDRASLTVHPSILCPDCGTHGFVTNGRWTDA